LIEWFNYNPMQLARITDFINNDIPYCTDPNIWRSLAKTLDLNEFDISHIALASQFSTRSPTKTFLGLYRNKPNATLRHLIQAFLNSLDDNGHWNKKTGDLLLSLIRNWFALHHYPVHMVDDAVAGRACPFYDIKSLLEKSEIITLFVLRFDPPQLWHQLASALHFTSIEISTTLNQITSPSNPCQLVLKKWLNIATNPTLETILDALHRATKPVSEVTTSGSGREKSMVVLAVSRGGDSGGGGSGGGGSESKQCVICLSQTLEILYMPCQHLVACQECSKRLNKCPLCRANITTKIKVFY